MKEKRRIVRQIRADKQTMNLRKQGPAGEGDHSERPGQAHGDTTQNR